MEQDKQVGHFVASILIKILPLLVFLCVGLYFGIRIGEGRYEFYKPNSPYYKKAIQQASSSGFSEDGTPVTTSNKKKNIMTVGLLVISFA